MWRNDFEFGKIGYESDILLFISIRLGEYDGSLCLQSNFRELHHDILLSLQVPEFLIQLKSYERSAHAFNANLRH